MRIVICDGHRVFADALASLLRAAGHEIAGTAVDLDEAAGMLETARLGGADQGGPSTTPPLSAGQGGEPPWTVPLGQPADACVIDLRVPRSGKRLEIERAIAAAPGTAFVVLSGSGDPSTLRHAIAAGVRGAALKGDDFGEFLDVLTAAVSGQAPPAAQGSAAEPGPVSLSASARAVLRRADGLAAGPSQFLTEREREVLARLVCGESTTGIARAMGVRVSTARTHIDAVLCKLGVHTRLEAVAYAVREGLVDVSAWQPEQPAVGA
jgi:DNA-binding NarL/FixJ family response regulator